MVVMTGGGTGGHVFPGIAVAEELQERYGVSVSWIGSKEGPEREIVERFGLPFRSIASGKLRRYLSLKNITDLGRILAGFFQAGAILGELEPDLVFSKGGYVSVPVVAAARLRGIPVITHESDIDPGLATRLNAPFADRICVAYEESRRHYADRYRGKLVVTGNPVRREILAGDRDEGLRIVGSSGERPLLFVQGGSSGAKQINELLEASLDRLLQRWTIVHQFGRTGRPLSKDPAYFGRGFFSAEYPHLLAAAELVVGRAGAGTIWELSASKTPAVLLPLGSASSRGDQLRNAELFAAAGAAVVLAPDEARPDRLTGVLEELSGNPGMRDRMAEAAGTFGGRHSAAACADLCMELARA